MLAALVIARGAQNEQNQQNQQYDRQPPAAAQGRLAPGISFLLSAEQNEQNSQKRGLPAQFTYVLPAAFRHFTVRLPS